LELTLKTDIDYETTISQRKIKGKQNLWIETKGNWQERKSIKGIFENERRIKQDDRQQ